MVDVYRQLAQYPVFTIDEAQRITGNKKTAYAQLRQLARKGLIQKVRNNIYSAINPATGQLVASRYQIACAITESAYLSHHSAFEYYGLANQVFNEVYVSSVTRFKTFSYDHVTYRHIASKRMDGVVEARNTIGVRLTDLERTVIDSIQDVNKVGGLDELLACLEGIPFLDEDRLLGYLAAYNTQGLYQRAGFLLAQYQKTMQLSDVFIQFCKEKIGSSTRYLTGGPGQHQAYIQEWKLMVPSGLFEDARNTGVDNAPV